MKRRKSGEEIMLKLNASFSKKVPADEEFSSQSYHASIEAELPDGLTDKQLKDKIHDTFELVRESVEAEIGNVQSNGSESRQHIRYPQGKRSSGNKQQDNIPASTKQINYLLDLARTQGMKPGELLEQAGVTDLKRLTKVECSRLIDELNGNAKAA